MSTVRSFAIAALALGLAACGGPDAPIRYPALPSSGDVLNAASTSAFRTMEHDSFVAARVRYPSEDGVADIPVGEYLAAKSALAFPRRAEVGLLRLDAFRAECIDQGFFGSEAACEVFADYSFRLYGRAQQATVTFAAVLGDVEEGDGQAFRVAEGFPAADPLSAQMRALVDETAARLEQAVRPMLIAANTRQAF
ncbi:MAG: hypothetical protein AAF684_03790 [Pseudomonadota bacterium]